MHTMTTSMMRRWRRCFDGAMVVCDEVFGWCCDGVVVGERVKLRGSLGSKVNSERRRQEELGPERCKAR